MKTSVREVSGSDIFYKIVRAIIRFIFRIVFFVKIEYDCEIPAEGALVISGNHISFLDAVFMVAFFPRKVHFMAKIELFKWGWFAWILRAMGAFPVNRHAVGVGAIKNSLKVLNRGDVLGIFPEGTSKKQKDQLIEFKLGAVTFAQRVGCPILPFGVITKDYEVKLFRRYKIHYGTPLTTEDLDLTGDSKEELRHATAILSERIAELSGSQYENTNC